MREFQERIETMNAEFVTVAAHRGAKCRSCEEIIPKGSQALKVSVHGSTQTANVEFHCMQCVPERMQVFENLVLEWERVKEVCTKARRLQVLTNRHKYTLEAIQRADARDNRERASELHSERRAIEAELKALKEK